MHKLPPIVLEEIGDTYQILQEELLGETFITKVETVQ